MKKGIIALVSIIGVIVIAVFFLVVFKEKKEEGKPNDTGNSENISSDKTVSIRDNDIYFVKINGTKFKAGDKVSNVSKIGLKQKEKDLKQAIPSNRYLMATSIVNDSNKEIFKVVPLNSTEQTITYADSVIGGIELGDYNYNKISQDTLSYDLEFVGGIKLGSSYEDVLKVFGEPDFKSEREAKELLPAYTSISYSSGYKGFEFIIDDSGKVSQIEWKNYDYNEN